MFNPKDRSGQILCLHDGVFHADDVLIAALLSDMEVVRTRNPEKITAADIVADVGMVYDPEECRFDHHQDDCPVYSNGVKYSAVGLVIQYLVASGEMSQSLADYLLENGLYDVQANDNGQKIEGLQASPFGFIHFMNATWEEGAYGNEQDEYFDNAVNLAIRVLDAMIEQYESKKHAEDLVNEAMKDSEDGIIILDQFIPWNEYVVKANEKYGVKFKTVVFQSKPNDWKVQVVPVALGSFDSWVHLDPESCTELPGFIFCHKGRFIAGFDNKESAIKAALNAR